MKWGVRKARHYGNDKALERHYRKAAKHLAKLEDIGNNPKKYAAKSAAYGVAAVGTGTIAIKGTDITKGLGEKLASHYAKKHPELNIYPHSHIVNSTKNAKKYEKYYNLKNLDSKISEWSKSTINPQTKFTNNDAIRLGSGIATAGLLAKSAQNAYRAANAKRYRKKAAQFRSAMNDTFAGTKYERLNGVPLPPKKKVRRKSK